MAKPIPFDLPKHDVKEELRAKLEQAPLEHAEAVLAGLEVLQGLHDRGVLELLHGVLGRGDEILEIAVEAAKTPEAIRGIRNLLIMAKVLGSIEPELLEKFARAVPDALESVAKLHQTDPPGFWGTLRLFRSKNLRRGIAVVNGVLESWGRHFSAGKTV